MHSIECPAPVCRNAVKDVSSQLSEYILSLSIVTHFFLGDGVQVKIGLDSLCISVILLIFLLARSPQVYKSIVTFDQFLVPFYAN